MLVLPRRRRPRHAARRSHPLLRTAASMSRGPSCPCPMGSVRCLWLLLVAAKVGAVVLPVVAAARHSTPCASAWGKR